MSSYILTSPIDILSSGTDAQINLYSTGSAFAAQFKAPTGLTANIDFTLPSTAGTVGQCLQRTGATSLGWATVTTTSTLGLPISFRTYQDSTTAVTVSSLSGFKNLLEFYFPGSIVLGGNPSSAYIVLSPSTNTARCQAQLLDLTNSTTVANVITGTFAAGSINLINLGTLSNIPSGPATWRLFITNISGSGNISIYYFKLL